MTCEITDGVENGVQYGVRVFLRGRYGFQTSRQNAQALVTPQASIPLETLPDGTLLRLGESGIGVNFRLLTQGYELTSNGSGKILVMREDIHSKRLWNTTINNVYASSEIHAWLNGTYLNYLDESVRGQIQDTSIPVVGSGRITTKVFLLSYTEVGFTQEDNRHSPIEGTALGYFSSNAARVAYLNGAPTIWWLRSKSTSGTTRYVLTVYSNGSNNSDSCDVADGIRPCFCLPAAMLFSGSPNADGSYSPVGSPYMDSV